MHKFEFTRNIVTEVFPFLVAYKVTLQQEVERLEKEVSFFTQPMKDLVIESLEFKRKELNDLEDLIKNYRNEF